MTSKGEINRCGDHLRDWWLDPALPGVDPASFDVVWDFRQSFQYPMQKTAVGLRQFVKRESSSVIVAQRLKRLPQIVHKLTRYPETKLARMEDIGGCRAILADRSEIDGVLGRIRRNWDVKRERDYIATPKTSGYRGVHVVVERDERRIEIQLRTGGQQAWAEAVERLASRYRLPLKDERGPDEVLEWLRWAALGIASEELGEPLPHDFEQVFAEHRDRMERWLEERR